MSERAQIEVLIDLDNDGVPETDVTADIDPPGGGVLLHTERGGGRLLDTDLIAGSLSTVLDRSDGSYPRGGSLKRGREVVVTATHDGTTYKAWRGRLERPQYPATVGPRVVSVSALGALSQLVGVKVTTGLHEDVDTGEAINLLLDKAGFGLVADAAENSIGNPVWGNGTYITGWTISGTHSSEDFADHPLAHLGITSGIHEIATGNFQRPQYAGIPVDDGDHFVAAFLMRRTKVASGKSNKGNIYVNLRGAGDSARGQCAGDGGGSGIPMPETDDWQLVLLSGQASSSAGDVTSLTLSGHNSWLDGIGNEMDYAYAGVFVGVDATFASSGTTEASTYTGKTPTWQMETFDPDNAEHRKWLVAGSMGVGYSWASTPHASASVRAPGEARDLTKRKIDEGRTILSHYWETDADALTALVTLLNTEGPGAKLYEAADGALTFKHRTARAQETRSNTSQATISGDGTEPALSHPFEYDPGEGEVVNEAAITVHRREVGDLSAVWQLGEEIILSPGQSVTYTAVAESEQATGAPPPLKDAVTPQAGTDYTLSYGSVSVSIDRTSGGRIAVTIAEAGGGYAILDSPGIQLRAKPVSLIGTTVIRNQVDASASIAEYGLRSWDKPMRHEISVQDAQNAADAIVGWSQAGRPSLLAGLLANASAERMAQALGREIGDRITVTEAETGVSADFYVEGVTLELSAPQTLTARLQCSEALSSNYALWDGDDGWDEGLWVW